MRIFIQLNCIPVNKSKFREAGLVVAIGLAMTKVFIINKRPYGGIAQTLAAFLERRCLPLQKAAFFIKTSQELGLHLNDSTFQSDL